MEPPVIAGCKLEGQFIVLEIVFANINMEAVRIDIVKRMALEAGFFRIPFPTDITAFHHFFPDLCKVILRLCNIERILDGFQMINLVPDFDRKPGECFAGTFQFPVFIKIFLTVFNRCKLRIKRNRDHFIGIVI